VPVKSFPPNGFRLHDMLGLVWQWVADCYDGKCGVPTYQGCDFRVLRGGSWDDPASNVRAGYRMQVRSGHRDKYTGFRVVGAVE